MFTKKLLVGLTIFLFGSYAITIGSGIYWNYPWLDIPMHFLGGAIVALFFAIYFEKDLHKISTISVIAFLLGATALVGVSWEFFEWIIDRIIFQKPQTPLYQPTINDTLGDLLLDLAGGLAVTAIYLKKLRFLVTRNQ